MQYNKKNNKNPCRHRTKKKFSVRLKRKIRSVTVKSSLYVPFCVRPYSRYPGYTTGRFGRFRSPGKSSQSDDPLPKSFGRVAGPRPLRSVPPGRETAPNTESPGSLVPKPSVCLPGKNRALRKWRTADLVESTGKAVQCPSRGFLGQVILRLIAPMVR